jgi:hypothetical protein
MTARYQRHLFEASADVYSFRATINRPADARTMRVAIHELRNRGLGDYEIANATALSVQYVRSVLSERNAVITRDACSDRSVTQ